MKLAADELLELAIKLSRDDTCSTSEMKKIFIDKIVVMLDDDIADNKNIGKFGAEAILSNLQSDISVKVLTHCNTGSLATAGYGTALGVVRRLHEENRLDRVYLTETRPFNQGSRLTAFEMVHDKVPATLICKLLSKRSAACTCFGSLSYQSKSFVGDSMVAYLFQKKHIQAVLVGADRVAVNGDTANKIGTYQIACLAAQHDIPFYICAPFTSIDPQITEGSQIVIEERPEHEMTYIAGKRVAAPGISVWNPAFDVTPARLIKGVITERGVFLPSELKDQLNL